MRIDTLEAWGVGHDILAIWRDTVGPNLLPVQERAVKECALFGGGNLIVFAPTSSGKTFIGEMAAVKAAKDNRKVFYLVPLKALAEEKYEEFRHRYASAGVRVVVSSRDHHEHDASIATRAFDIAVVVYEKLATLLVSQPQLLDVVGLVVVDELQLITDQTRGPGLELLLTRMRLAAGKPAIVGLSAVLGRAHSLADWLGAKLLVETERPVELRKGVLCRGTYTYREHNSRRQGTEEMLACSAEKRPELLLSAAEDRVRQGEQALVFLPDRVSTVHLARVLAERVSLPSVDAAIEELRQQEETHARDVLAQVLGSSIAFHNADLSPEERAIVERHFRSGAIRVLFSTSTLAMGLNFPTKNVILDGNKWTFLRRYRRWSLEEMTKSEYENMSGRAGRLSLTEDFGRSILVTSSPFEAKVWLDYFVNSDFEDVVPTLKDAPLEDHVLAILASGMAATRAGLREMLLASFTGTVYWTQKMSREEFVAALDSALERCLEGGLLKEDGGTLSVTVLGQALATKGIDVATGLALARWAREAKDAAVSDLEVLAMLASSPGGEGAHINMTGDERYRADYKGQILRRASEACAGGRPLFAELAADEMGIEYETAKALKKALLLDDWIGEVPTKDIERRFSVWAGTLRRVGEEFSWLAEGLAAIGRATGWSEARRDEVQCLSTRLLHGVRAEAIGIAGLRVRGLGRTLVRRLVAAGLTDEASLRAAGADAVRKALNHRGAFASLWAALTERASGVLPQYPTPDAAVPMAAEPGPAYQPEAGEEPVLVVDLRERRVKYRGCEIRTKPPNNLQRQPLLALAVLAGRPGEVLTMADLAEGMFKLGGLRKRPVAPDAKDLRYKLLRPFKKALGGAAKGELDQLMESVPGVGLRLNVSGAVKVLGMNQTS